MTFDQVCKFIEGCNRGFSDLGDLDRLLRDAKIFDLPDVEDAVIAEHSDHTEDFRLPFPVIAACCKEGVCIVSGTRAPYDLHCFGESAEGIANCVFHTEFTPLEDGQADFSELRVGIDYSKPGADSVHASVNESPQEAIDFIVGWAVEVVRTFIVLNDSRNFVLEQASTKMRPPKSYCPNIPRLNQRPKYTFIRPHAAREIMGLPQPQPGEHGKKVPHERRGHFRRFRSEFYKAKRGSRRWIEDTFIGPKEAIVGNKHYRIVWEKPPIDPDELTKDIDGEGDIQP